MSALRVTSNEISSKSVLLVVATICMMPRVILGLSLTLPGTYWCGPGNSSSGTEKLGSFKMVDGCCRAHDECADYIPPGETKHDLKNDGIVTQLSCECDLGFHKCLTDVGSLLSYQIRYIYFNKPLRSKCFRLDYPIVKCTKYYGFILKSNRCKEYELDTTASKKYQWFDLPIVRFLKT